ncbi:hypothetical protein WK94_04850 [Burkholderia ubonensis]|uniref:EexN family lipoprotein n=1 Tax=Burkholderia ubonensis TaxID=101571 RepID=UPI000758B0AA|nr:EexN family lipoprotein [Burkholderia ubonensis]KVT64560.1 hypothetical protein WK56_32160 [Burkholderia ubonensis]KVW31563.1 hypothetical protein WK94_04850 [Burkholderia ubonensis]
MKKCLYVLVACVLAACGQEYHTKAWYIEHDAERASRFKVCENDPAQYLRQGSDCLNAKEANAMVAFYGKEAALKAAHEQ